MNNIAVPISILAMAISAATVVLSVTHQSHVRYDGRQVIDVPRLIPEGEDVTEGMDLIISTDPQTGETVYWWKAKKTPQLKSLYYANRPLWGLDSNGNVWIGNTTITINADSGGFYVTHHPAQQEMIRDE